MENQDIDHFIENVQAVEREIQKVIVGQSETVRLVLTGILAGGHVLLEGVPGLGKTMLIRTFGQVMDLSFSRIQFTPDLMPADIVGSEILVDENGQRSFRFRKGPIFSNLVLADEINRATPKTQSALLEAMQEHSVTVGDRTSRLDEPFFVLATQNPLEMEGTYPLPEAQLDRFLFKIKVPFPAADDLARILDRTTGGNMPSAEKRIDGNEVISMRSLACQTPAPAQVTDWIARLIVATHPDHPQAPPLIKQYVRYGSSPRGAQALMLGAKVTALLAGRYNVAFDDVRSVIQPALRHRLILNFEGLASGVNPDEIINDLIASVETLPK